MGSITLKLEEYIYKFYFIISLWLLEIIFLLIGSYFNYWMLIPLVLIILSLYLVLDERIKKVWMLNSLIFLMIISKCILLYFMDKNLFSLILLTTIVNQIYLLNYSLKLSLE